MERAARQLSSLAVGASAHRSGGDGRDVRWLRARERGGGRNHRGRRSSSCDLGATVSRLASKEMENSRTSLRQGGGAHLSDGGAVGGVEVDDVGAHEEEVAHLARAGRGIADAVRGRGRRRGERKAPLRGRPFEWRHLRLDRLADFLCADDRDRREGAPDVFRARCAGRRGERARRTRVAFKGRASRKCRVPRQSTTFRGKTRRSHRITTVLSSTQISLPAKRKISNVCGSVSTHAGASI